MKTTPTSLYILFVLISNLISPQVMTSNITNVAEPTKAVGWHWYNEIHPETKDFAKDEADNELSDKKGVSALTQITALREEVQEAKAKAILYPTTQNVRAYLVLQNFVMEKAMLFTRAWKQALLKYPELDYGVLHPTQNNAQHVLYARERQREDAAIKYYSKYYGLLFFYRGDNLLDQELAPTIKSFSEDNNIALIPVSVDGKILDSLVTSHIDRGQATKLQIKHYPALILVNPKTQEIQALHYGFISESELRRRFLQLATNFQEGV